MKRYILFGLSALMIGTNTMMAQEAETVNSKDTKSMKTAKQYPTRKVKGRVLSSATNLPVSGALVSVGEMQGYSVLTNDKGEYELNVPEFASTLQVTAPDYNLVKIGLLRGDSQRDIKLYSSAFSSEYIFGTNVTGQQAASGFQYSNAVSVEDEIQKRMGAEVHTVARNGNAGTGSVMFINGLNSLNVNAQPLVVVDGVIIEQQYGRMMLHDGFYNNILNNISPTDIEKVTVLRNGTALYGAKGANGVIIIETRRSHSMATRITASLSAGVVMQPKFYDMMNATQYKSYASDMLSTTNTMMTSFKFLNDDPSYYYYPQYHNNTDWKKGVYRTALTQNYNINVEGGDNVADYNLSLGYISNQTTLKCNNLNRLNIRFNADIHLTEKFSMRFDASFANQTRNIRNDGAPEGYNEGTPTSPAFLAYVKSPMLSPYAYANGILSHSYLDVDAESYLDEALSGYKNYNYKLGNPYAINEYADAENKNRWENSMVNLAVTPKFQFNKHLCLSEHFSYNLVNTNEKFYIPISGVPNYYVSSVGGFRENEVRSLFSKQNSVMSDTRLDWNNRYGPHAIYAFAGARINWESYTLNTQLGYNTGNDKTPFISSSLLNIKTTGANDNWTSIAWYAQAEYNYLQRYYLQGNLTAEASSRFGKDADGALKAFNAAWGIFPGIQASWVISNETWFANVSAVNYLKLSAGYDVSGNDDIDYYAARSFFSSTKYLQSVSGLTFENIGNNHLKWEITRRWNIGLETNLFNNRLNLRFNYFNSRTEDILTYQSLNYISGIEKNWCNSGSLKNNGFDVTAKGKLINAKDFSWELGASVGHYKNEIVSLSEGQTHLDNTVYGATIRTQVGSAANLFYGYRTAGVYSTSEEAKSDGLYVMGSNGIDKNYFGAGDMKFVDEDKNHVINENDRDIIGDPNPDIYGNIFTSFAYKRFRLDMNFNYSLGNDVYNYMRQQLESGSRFMNQTLAMTNRWQNEGQVTKMPKATFQDPMGNSRFSDRWIEDGSYIRLKTVTLSYTLPVNSTLLQGFQFWVQANNLFTLTKYLGSDPEFTMTNSVVGQGIDLGQLPQSCSIVAGVKINL